MDNNINLNLYKVFYEVAKNQSISVASKNLFVSQPAISKSIKTLEDSLNTKLFYRTTSGVILTQKGDDLFKYVSESLNTLKYAETCMKETENLERGSLTIGAPSHIIAFFLLERLYLFHDKYPNIDINIISRSSSDLLKMLNNNEIDIVIDISSYKDDLNQFTIKKLKKLKHCFVVSSKNKDIDVSKITSITDLKELPLVLPVFNSSHRKRLDELAKDNGTCFNNVISIETSEIIYNAIKNNVGIGYILYGIVKDEVENGKMIELNIKEELPIVNMNLIYKEKLLTIVATKFIDEFLSDL